jgi:hypothetical protein
MSKKQNNVFIINKYIEKKTKEIPQYITHLYFEIDFNPNIYNYHKNLTYITFGIIFNQKVDNLPQNLIHLTFKNDFNKKIDNLPKNLMILNLRTYKFNQKIDKLPKNLVHLTLFSVNFNKSINCLPKSLTSFAISWLINCDIKLPKNVNYLLLTCNNNLINNIPEHIEILNIYFDNYKENKYIENLPSTIKKIIIKDEECQKYIKKPFGTVLTIKPDYYNKGN